MFVPNFLRLHLNEIFSSWSIKNTHTTTNKQANRCILYNANFKFSVDYLSLQQYSSVFFVENKQKFDNRGLSRPNNLCNDLVLLNVGLLEKDVSSTT